MSAELALMNQILNKALKNNVDVNSKTVKVGIKAGNQAILAGERLQLDDDGLVYPPSAVDSDLNGGQVITSTNTPPNLSGSNGGSFIQLDGTHYAGIQSNDIYIFEYDEENNIWGTKSSFDLGTLYNSYNYIAKVKNGLLALHYSTDSDSSYLKTVAYDSDYAMTAKYTSGDLACDSYSRKSAPIILDDTRVLITYYKGGYVHSIFELNDDGTLDSSSLAQTNDVLGRLNSYAKYLDRTKSGIADGYAYLAYNNNLVKIAVQATTGTDITITDKTSETDVLMGLNTFNIAYSKSYSGRLFPMLYTWRGASSDTAFFIEKYGSLVKPIFDDDGDCDPVIYKPAGGQLINTSIFYNTNYSTRMVMVGENKAYLYSIASASVGYYSHNLYEIILDDDTSTFTMKLIAQKPFSHIETTSHGSGYVWMQLTDSGVLATNTRVYDGSDYFNESFLGTDNTNYVSYTKTKLIAMSDIAADEESVAYVDGDAFVADATANAGDTVLSKFKVTSTGYAVEKE